MNAISEMHGLRVLTCEPDGVTLASESDALDLIGKGLSEQVDVLVVPADRVADPFFVLSSGVAGQVILKFNMYRIRLVIVGDISRHLDASSALRALVHESNRGKEIWFFADHDELAERLRSA